jgi:hypothetical protein
MNWSLYARTGRMGLPVSTSALEMTQRVETGGAVELAGRVLSWGDGAARVEAVATTPAGTRVGRLEREYALVDEATFCARMGYDALPAGYEGAFGD